MEAEQNRESRTEELMQALAFAEKNWREESQATTIRAAKVAKLEAEVENLKDQLEEAKVWQEAYEAVINSKTWKLANKMKKPFGKG